MSDSLDTSLLLRYFLNDSPEKKQKIIKLLDSDGKHFLSTFAISETVFFLERVGKRPRAEVENMLFFFLASYSDKIVFDRRILSDVFPFFLEHPKLSFIDCCLAFEAHKRQADPLYTFDQKLAKQSPYAKLL